MIDGDRLYENLDEIEEPKAKEDLREPRENDGKNLITEKDGVKFKRLPIKTHVISDNDDICDAAQRYAKPHLMPDDILFISKKAVSISQGRAIPLEAVKARKLAVLLSSLVAKTKSGSELDRPETMEMAIRECGTLRIIFAAFAGALGRLFRKNDLFYRAAGNKATSISGPSPEAIHPYERFVVLCPDEPDKVASNVRDRVGCRCVIVDINDTKAKVLGVSDRTINSMNITKLLADNPLGQRDESTPMGILRALDDFDPADE